MTDLLRILAGPVVWLVAFNAVYGLHGLQCELAPGMLSPRLVFATAFVLAVVLQIAIVAVLHSDRYGAATGFTRIVSRTSGWTGLVATIWTLFPTLVIPTCV